MVHRLLGRGFATTLVAIWFAATLPVVMASAPEKCRAADHQCPEMTSLSCCCDGDDGSAVAVGVARPVAKASILHTPQPPAVDVAIDVLVAIIDARLTLSVVVPPSTAGPPLDRSILYLTLRV